MALFGVPRAHEDDPARAVKAALEIHAAARRLSPKVEARLGRQLSMHTGINTGLVVVGELGLGRRQVLGLLAHVVGQFQGLNALPGGLVPVGVDSDRLSGALHLVSHGLLLAGDAGSEKMTCDQKLPCGFASKRLTTPVLFLIFNRPDTTQQVFNEIQKAKPARLFVAADGPRGNKPDDAERCQAARGIIKQVDWDCKVKTLFQKRNLGCGLGPVTAINWFFDNVERLQLIEKDNKTVYCNFTMF
jgi:hypothetical protein